MDVPVPLLAFVCIAIPISVEDLRSLRIPNRLIIVAAIGVAVALWGRPLSGASGIPGVQTPPASLAESFGGLLYAGGVLEVARRVTGGALGGGDVKLGLVLGAAAGPAVAAGVILAAALSALLYFVLLRGSNGRWGREASEPGGARARRVRPRPVPFAPFLTAAAFAAVCAVSLGGVW